MVNQSLARVAPVNPLKTQNLLTHRTAHGITLVKLEYVGLTVNSG
jgi:hypothetical protein